MTSADYEWDRRARTLEFEQLTSVRASAEQWRNGLGALTGTLATVAVLKGTDTFRELTPEGRRLAIWALGTAFVLLVTGSYSAMRAAFTQRGLVMNSAEALKEWTVAETKKSTKFLLAAQIMTALALLLLAIGTAISWLDSGESPREQLTVVLVDGSKICGTVQQSKDGGFDLLLDATTSQQVHLRLADVQSLIVGKC